MPCVDHVISESGQFDIYKSKVSFFEAKSMCESVGSQLAILKQEKLRHELMRSLPTSPCTVNQYWIGLTGRRNNLNWLDGGFFNDSVSCCTSYGCSGGILSINQNNFKIMAQTCTSLKSYICYKSKDMVNVGMVGVGGHHASDVGTAVGLSVFLTFITTVILVGIIIWLWKLWKDKKRTPPVSFTSPSDVCTSPDDVMADDRGYIDLNRIVPSSNLVAPRRIITIPQSNHEYCTIDPPNSRADNTNHYLVPI